jgi:hypothetical protein
MLVIVMTIFRERMGIQEYIELKQYRYLSFLFIVMSVTWFYFTYTEHLTLFAEQETMEFPVLTSKLWGKFAPSFWGMVILMAVATWFLVVPRLTPSFIGRIPVFRPGRLLPQGMAAGLIAILLLEPAQLPSSLSLEGDLRVAASVVEVLLLLVLSTGCALWFKKHLVLSMVISSVCVVAGMWLERWNIIVPTVTHPRLIPYGNYFPSTTEMAITAASFALLVLGPLLFFKFFPVISIWELAEGRVIDEAQASIKIPAPKPAGLQQKKRLGFKRLEL